MLEGFSDKKREAWENFVNTYGDKEQINSAKDALLQYRTEVSKIKEEMKRQHETLSNYITVSISGVSKVNIDNIPLRIFL